MTMKDFGMGFFGRRPFGWDGRHEAMKKFREEWSNMSDSEKIDLMNKRMEMMNQMENHMSEFSGKDRLSVENMDKRCEEWMKMTSEEKEEFMKNRRETFGRWRGED